mmetsp:Transcript_40607/g.71454  ORF Transcript_40607/g.71454 Transcript_40607/m.71454 type:complete len:215 (-) Transcript_40607:21-665(-)
MPGAELAVLAAAVKAPSLTTPLALSGPEQVGVACCGTLSCCAVCVCSLANIKHRMCGKDYVHSDLAEGKHEVGKSARVRYYKNAKLVGMGRVTFDGKGMELSFLPKRFNLVSLAFMSVKWDGTYIILQDTRRNGSKQVFEFAEAAEAKAWKSVLTKAAREVTAAYHSSETEDKFKDLAKQLDEGQRRNGRYESGPEDLMPSFIACCLSRAPQAK